MRIFFPLLIICSCIAASSQSTRNLISTNDNIGTTNLDSLIEISVDYKEIEWNDSINVGFLTITHVDDKYELKHLGQTVSKKYRNLGGPITIGNRLRDSCLIYPILTKGNTSFFLTDDVNHLTDTIVSLSISLSVGEYDKNQAYSFYFHLSIRLSELNLNLDSLKSSSNMVVANNEWYNKWVSQHPNYSDQRIRNLNMQCK